MVSSHAVLKQFFPLQTGDGVIHSFDVLHGVDMDPSIDLSRTSLIIWFVDRFGNCNSNHMRDESEGSEIFQDQPQLIHPHSYLDRYGALCLRSEKLKPIGNSLSKTINQ